MLYIYIIHLWYIYIINVYIYINWNQLTRWSQEITGAACDSHFFSSFFQTVQVQETFKRRADRFLKAKNENLLFIRVVNGTQDAGDLVWSGWVHDFGVELGNVLLTPGFHRLRCSVEDVGSKCPRICFRMGWVAGSSCWQTIWTVFVYIHGGEVLVHPFGYFFGIFLWFSRQNRNICQGF